MPDPYISEECNKLNYEYCNSVIAAQENVPEEDRVSPLGRNFPRAKTNLVVGMDSIPVGKLNHYITVPKKRLRIMGIFDRLFFKLHSKFPKVFKYTS